jgi:hypothetical protein
MCIHLSAHAFLHAFLRASVHASTHMSTRMSTHMSTHMVTHMSTHMSTRASTQMPTHKAYVYVYAHLYTHTEVDCLPYYGTTSLWLVMALLRIVPLYRHRRQHVYCAGLGVLVHTLAGSARAFQRYVAQAHRTSIHMSAHMSAHMSIHVSIHVSTNRLTDYGTSAPLSAVDFNGTAATRVRTHRFCIGITEGMSIAWAKMCRYPK